MIVDRLKTKTEIIEKPTPLLSTRRSKADRIATLPHFNRETISRRLQREFLDDYRTITASLGLSPSTSKEIHDPKQNTNHDLYEVTHLAFNTLPPYLRRPLYYYYISGLSVPEIDSIELRQTSAETSVIGGLQLLVSNFDKKGVSSDRFIMYAESGFPDNVVRNLSSTINSLQILYMFIGNLPKETRDVVHLHFEEGISIEQLAHLHNSSVEVVKRGLREGVTGIQAGFNANDLPLNALKLLTRQF